MVWSLDDKPVLTISNHTGVLPSVDPHVTAEPLRPGSLRLGWVFSLNTTEVQDQAKVTCDLLNIQRETASLFVQGWCLHAGRKQKGGGLGSGGAERVTWDKPSVIGPPQHLFHYTPTKPLERGDVRTGFQFNFLAELPQMCFATRIGQKFRRTQHITGDFTAENPHPPQPIDSRR